MLAQLFAIIALALAYNPQGAVGYASSWWNGANHDCSKDYLSCTPWSYFGSEHCGYPSHGGDCANFVSQCLVQGGGHTPLNQGGACRGYPCGKEEPGATNLGNCLSGIHGWRSSCGYMMAPPSDISAGDVIIYHSSSCGDYDSHATIVISGSGGGLSIACHSPATWNARWDHFTGSKPYVQYLHRP